MVRSFARGEGLRMPYRRALPFRGQGEDAGSYKEKRRVDGRGKYGCGR